MRPMIVCILTAALFACNASPTAEDHCQAYTETICDHENSCRVLPDGVAAAVRPCWSVVFEGCMRLQGEDPDAESLWTDEELDLCLGAIDDWSCDDEGAPQACQDLW